MNQTKAQPPQRPRTLQITRNLPPLRGGMERLNLHMALEIAKEFDLAVIGPSGCRERFSDDISVHEVMVKPLWSFFVGALWQCIVAAFRDRPDVVLAGSGLTAPFAWLTGKLAGARTVVYAHGLDLIEPHPVYRWFWRPFIRRADVCIVNSQNTRKLAVSVGVPEARLIVIHPGVDIPSDVPSTNDFRSRFGLGTRPLMLSVGRLIARKGLLEFLEYSMPAIVAAEPEACLVVLGEELPALLHGSSSGLGERIRARAKELGIDANVRFIGTQDDPTLFDAYRSANVHVFPVCETAGDVEGFGMVALEAAAYGLPTVAFAVGGVADAVEEGTSGHLAAPGDYPGFAEAVLQYLRTETDSASRASAMAFAERFDWLHFGDAVRRVLRTTLNGVSV